LKENEKQLWNQVRSIVQQELKPELVGKRKDDEITA